VAPQELISRIPARAQVSNDLIERDLSCSRSRCSTPAEDVALPIAPIKAEPRHIYLIDWLSEFCADLPLCPKRCQAGTAPCTLYGEAVPLIYEYLAEAR
jgi:hypothetical protein